MTQTISVTFFARKDRATDDGLKPVFMRISLMNKRLTLATKIFVKSNEWSDEGGKLKTNSEEARRVNKMLEAFKMKALDYQRELMNEGKDVTLENMKAKWYGLTLEKVQMLMDVFKEHNV